MYFVATVCEFGKCSVVFAFYAETHIVHRIEYYVVFVSIVLYRYRSGYHWGNLSLWQIVDDFNSEYPLVFTYLSSSSSHNFNPSQSQMNALSGLSAAM